MDVFAVSAVAVRIASTAGAMDLTKGTCCPHPAFMHKKKDGGRGKCEMCKCKHYTASTTAGQQQIQDMTGQLDPDQQQVQDMTGQLDPGQLDEAAEKPKTDHHKVVQHMLKWSEQPDIKRLHSSKDKGELARWKQLQAEELAKHGWTPEDYVQGFRNSVLSLLEILPESGRDRVLKQQVPTEEGRAHIKKMLGPARHSSTMDLHLYAEVAWRIASPVPARDQWVKPEFETNEFERVVDEGLYPSLEFARAAFDHGQLVRLEPESREWREMENTDSGQDMTMDEVRSLAAGYGRNVDSLLEGLESGANIPAATVARRKDGSTVCIGGNTRLMVCRAAGRVPQVWMVSA